MSTRVEPKSKRLETDLNESCLRYMEIRIDYFRAASEGGEKLAEVDARRTRAHDALIANFTAVLRSLKHKPNDMVAAYHRGRVEIGIWGLRRAVDLVAGHAKTLTG